MARILGAVARKESDDKSRRTRRKHLELAEAGAPVGGGRPFGYEDDRVTVRPAEAALIREAVDRVLAGDSIRSIAMDWNRRGIPAVRGGAWGQKVLLRLLLSHRIAGQRSLGRDGPVVAKAAWPAIIDETTHARVRDLLLRPERQATAGFGARKYLLTGFLVCGRCGTRLIAQPRSDRSRSYTCSGAPGRDGCGGVRVVAQPLEDLVVEAVMQRLAGPELAEMVRAEHGRDDEERSAGAEAAAAEAKLEELAQEWAADRISKAEWLAARRAVEARLDAARRTQSRYRRTSALDAFVGETGILRAAWPELSLERRRAVIAALVDRISIGPAVRGRNRFDPERVDVTWRA